MKKLITVLALFFSVFFNQKISYSQVTEKWVRSYNSGTADGFFSVVTDHSGNVYAGGITYNGDDEVGLLVKYDSVGNEVWVRFNNGPGVSDEINALAVDDSGNVIATGISNVNINNDLKITTLKYDSTGDLKWIQRSNNINVYNYPSIVIDTDGNSYITAYDKTIKYSAGGEMLWIKPFGDGVIKQIAIDNTGYVFVTGINLRDFYHPDIQTIKYNFSGDELWVRIYDGPVESDDDVPTALAVDLNGNVIISGYTNTYNSLYHDFITIKYSFSGFEQWVRTYNGEGNYDEDQASSIAVDNSGNSYVTGQSYGSETGSDYATIKYTSSGVQEWVMRFDGGQYASPKKIVTDNSGNSYVTGRSGASEFETKITTIKYNPSGSEEWVQQYNGSYHNYVTSMAIDDLRNLFVVGWTANSSYDDINGVTIKYSQKPPPPEIFKPAPYSKWISGDYDTIKWTNARSDVIYQVKCVINYGTPIEEVLNLSLVYEGDSSYIWLIPDTLLSYRTKFILEDILDTTQKFESPVFRIKPYLLTKTNDDSTYYEFRKDRDQWGFSNIQPDMWPKSWYSQFNYHGTDPFTNEPYPFWEFGLFTADSDFIDWISFVNTFTTGACYTDLASQTYSPSAVHFWRVLKGLWGGSCFGIAIANAIVFRNKEEFAARYPSYPSFSYPASVISTDPVKKTINELFTYQYGREHVLFRMDSGKVKTPTETLNEIKKMVLSDNDPVRTLDIFSNDSAHPGGHTINVYGVTKSYSDPGIYYLKVYDNANPNSTSEIKIDTTDFEGRGSWYYPNFPQWGGEHFIYLMEPAITYLNNPAISGPGELQSPFGFRYNNMVDIYNSNASITIKDNAGNVTGFSNNTVSYNIPNSMPLIVANGSEGPPYGYELENDEYSVTLNDFQSDNAHADFFNGNRILIFDRTDAMQAQTDELFFDKYGNGIHVKNPDAQTKEIKLENIINWGEEKVLSVSSLELAQNDSINLNIFYNDEMEYTKLTSTGTEKNYNLDLYLAHNSGLDKFSKTNVFLPENTTHIFYSWDRENSDFIILQDIGNNGTIDDTITLSSLKTLDIKVLIEGFYNSGTNIMVSDTITVYLKNVSPPFNVVDSAQCVLAQNGNGTLHFSNPANKIPYYITVKHRNSIETWSSGAVTFSSNNLSYDFTTDPSKAFGNNLILKGNKYCIYSGDVNQDGTIDLVDITDIYNSSVSFTTGYVVTDIDGNNTVDLSDITLAYNNSVNYVSVRNP